MTRRRTVPGVVVEEDLVPVSRRRLALFRIYLHWFVRRHFHAIRIAHGHRFREWEPLGASRPLIVYMNHPSWWDPLMVMLVSEYLMPAVDHYGPFDAAALAHYGIFRRLGGFSVEQETRRGAAQFLRSSMAVLQRPNSALWITPQGSFFDVRQRPLNFRSGLRALLERIPQATVLPVALEYTFWNERLPEVLVSVGEPFVGDPDRLELGLTAAQEELAVLSMARDASAFETIVTGAAGAGGVYATWQRLLAAVRGREYIAEHSKIGHTAAKRKSTAEGDGRLKSGTRDYKASESQPLESQPLESRRRT